MLLALSACDASDEEKTGVKGSDSALASGDSESGASSLMGNGFSSDRYFDLPEEYARLSGEEIKALIADIPSDKYESYPDTHTLPISATLYKDGKSVSLDQGDPRLIRLVNFFNNCVHNSSHRS